MPKPTDAVQVNMTLMPRDPLIPWLEERTYEEEQSDGRRKGRSAAAYRALAHHATLLQRELAEMTPPLTEGEALCLCTMMKGTAYFPERMDGMDFVMHLDNIDYDILREWGIYGSDFKKRLLNLTPGQAAALYDAIEVAWRRAEAVTLYAAIRSVGLVQ